MRLLLDMNLPPSVANWLRSEGHDALHVRDLGLSGAPDSEIFARAAADGRIVVSFDLDFGEVAGLRRRTPKRRRSRCDTAQAAANDPAASSGTASCCAIDCRHGIGTG